MFFSVNEKINHKTYIQELFSKHNHNKNLFEKKNFFVFVNQKHCLSTQFYF